ncbi:MAG TPA: hypothetical protein VJ873_00265, partial [bacterium]|nr:hypothetical protein [bacterium]
LGVNDKGKKIFERSSTPQGRQSEAPATVKTFPVAHGAMGDGSADKTSPAPLSLEAERQRLSSEGGRNDGKDKPGPLGAHTKTLGEKLQGTPTVIEQNLEKDAKQAVNYQVRRGMRNFLRNLFN